jgi:hypothetical protein
LGIRTFLDASVLIAAYRGIPYQRNRPVAILNDSDRFFIASDFLSLETVPKAVYYGNRSEVEFYERYFAKVSDWIKDVESIVRIADAEAENSGLSAMDALHIAAAYLAEADVLYTLEGPGKPICRTSLVRVVSIGESERA